jgi:hypothetical protein
MPGLKVWQRERGSLTLTAKAEFSLKPSGGDCDIQVPTAIITASLRNSDGQDSPLKIMRTIQEYEGIGDKSATGDPGAIFYERRLDEGKLYTDVVPSDLTKTIRFVYLQPLEDLDANTNDLDFPAEYLLPIAHNLGINVAPKLGMTLSNEHASAAAASGAIIQSFEPETSTVYFEPGRDD